MPAGPVAARGRRFVLWTVARTPADRGCQCGSALAHAILTDRKRISLKTKKKFLLLAGKYLR